MPFFRMRTSALCLTSRPSGEQTFLYLCWYLIMSLLGHYNNFFFACHLLDIAMGVKTLRTILSSVTHNGTQVGGWGGVGAGGWDPVRDSREQRHLGSSSAGCWG